MEKYYSTGAFAKKANVSVRTVQYYDRINLLKPSYVESNGYRKYSMHDFLKLQKIISLKYLGFSLDEIAVMVNKDDKDLTSSLQLQLHLLEQQIMQLQSLKNAMQDVLSHVKKGNINWDGITNLIQMMSNERVIIEHYRSTENLNVRIKIHQKYSQNPVGWFTWIFSQIDFSKIERLLEVGCGTGQLWEACNIDLRNREVFLSDISSGMVESVRKKFGDLFSYFVIDCNEIPFRKEYFDAVVANHVLFYVNNVSNAVQEIQRVLKPNGVMYCTTYGKEHMKEISELARSFHGKITLSNNNLPENFGLENGKQILQPFFSHVEVKRYEDELIVDNADMLCDYILSCHGNQREIIGKRIQEFREFIRKYIEEHGALHITKDAGMFVCIK